MSSREALNLPVEVTLGGSKYKVREVPLLRIVAIVEQYILDSKLRKIEQMASILEGDEKLEYVMRQGDKLPEGNELEGLATGLMKSGNMPNVAAVRIIHEAMKADQSELTENEVTEAFNEASQAEASLVIKIVTGSKKGQTPAGPRSGKSRKSTTGRRR